MKYLVSSVRKLQTIYFLASILISIYFGAGGHGIYTPFVILFGPFSLPAIFLEKIVSYAKVENGDSYIFNTVLINIFFITIQPFVYYKFLKNLNFSSIKKLIILHFTSALIISFPLVPKEIQKLEFFIFGVIVAIIGSIYYWFAMLDLARKNYQSLTLDIKYEKGVRKKEKVSNPDTRY